MVTSDTANDARVRPFRLAVYTESLERGGAEVNLANLLARLPAQVDVHVIGPERQLLEWLVAERPGSTIHRIDPVSHRSEVAGMLAHRRLFRALRADLLQFNLGMMPAAQWALLMAQSIPGQRTLVVENSTMGAWSATSKLLKRLTSRRASGHITVGRAAARLIETTGDLRPGSVGTIYHGVPDVRHDVAAPSPVLRVVNLARHDPVKGVDLLLETMALLPDDVVLAQYGDGPESAALAAQCSRLGLDDRVEFISLPWEVRVADRICEHDLFVLSSRTEGLPVSIVEAMLAGLAVIAPDVGSVREVVDVGVTGLVVPPGEPQAFADAVLTLRDDPDRRRAMGAAGRHEALERFTIESTVAEYCDLFERLLSTGGSRRAQRS